MQRQRNCSSYRAALLLGVVASVGCGGSGGNGGNENGDPGPPAQVAGDYDVTLRNVSNGCGFGDWEDGGTTTDIGMGLTQNESAVEGRLQGLAGTLVALLIGTADFSGTVSGDHVELVAYSAYTSHVDACIQSLVVTMGGDVSGNVWSGELEYTYVDNGAPDCEQLADCVSRQSFDAVRISP